MTRRRALLAAGGVASDPADAPGRAQAAGGVTRQDAIAELQDVRVSIDETLALFKAGRDAEALEKARSGYLTHFEAVEIPLRVVDPTLTVEAESLFAEVRQLVKSGAPASQVRDKVVELRGVIDDVERRLTIGQRRRGSHRGRAVLPHHLP